MLKTLAMAALCAAITASALAQGAAPAAPSSAAKKELIARVLELQKPGFEITARQIAEQPAMQMLQQVDPVIQQRIAPDKREAIARDIEADARKYVEEAVPPVRDIALKSAPGTFGATIDERMDEAELRQLLTMVESPVFKKYQALLPDAQRAFMTKLVADARPVLEPKVRTLEASIRKRIGATSAAPAASAPGGKK
jgi:hypothetical protein